MSRSLRLKAALWLPVLLLCASAPVRAAGMLRAEAKLDKQTASIAEPVTYSLSIESEEGTEIGFPQTGDTLGNFTVIDFDRRQSTSGARTKTVLDYRLKSFHAGEQVIPELKLSYRLNPQDSWQETAVGEQKITIESDLEADESARRLRDIRAPLALPRIGLWIFFFLLVLAAAAVFWWLRLRKRVCADEFARQRMIPAHETALAELAGLKRKGLIEQGKLEEYFVEVSGIVRRYLENRFSLHAPEMTTEEFLQHVREQAVLEGRHKQLLKEFLECCDLVKFARYEASLEECDSVYDSAVHFVEETKQLETADTE